MLLDILVKILEAIGYLYSLFIKAKVYIIQTIYNYFSPPDPEIEFIINNILGEQLGLKPVD